MASTESGAKTIIVGITGASGIVCDFRGETVRTVHGLGLGDLSAVKILVSAADEEEARRLLQKAEAGEFSLDEDTET
jgi:hypothetical protein